MKIAKLKYDIPYSLLKWSALFFMTYDHILRKIFNLASIDILMFSGRFAFPIFAFMIARNLSNKNIFQKYLNRLIPFAILTIPIDLIYYPEYRYLNIMFTFIASISLLWGLKLSTDIKNKPLKCTSTLLLIFATITFGRCFDYGTVGLWLIPAVYLFIKKQSWQTFALALIPTFLIMPSFLFAGLITIFMAALLLSTPIPSAIRSTFKKTGWLYYAYFPIHKLIIALIA